MELNKTENNHKNSKKILFVVGACTALLIAATAFAGGSKDAAQVQSRSQSKMVAATEKKVQATGLKINNNIEVYLKSKEEAQKVIKQVELDFVGTYQKTAKVTTTYDEKVEQVPVEVTPNQISTVEAAVTLIKEGRTKVVTYTVAEGDNLWTIARKNDLHVEEIRQANPGLNTDFIDVGQIINLVKPQPLVHITVSVENTVTEEIPFPVKINVDKKLRSGVEKVKQAGKKGSKEVTYRLIVKNGIPMKKDILAQRVIENPVEQIVLKGPSKQKRTISRGDDDGSTSLRWPTKGAISSPFGSRWGRRHTGLDIDGVTGQAVRAADDGKVVFAGWDGAYGKMVSIRHSDGVTTRYAHLSSIGVSVGDSVSRGEYIGDVGSTGRSTGSHLHFEVLKNGSFKNPTGYLR